MAILDKSYFIRA